MIKKRILEKNSQWNSKCNSNGVRDHCKKRLWFTIITMLCFIVITSLTISGCDKQKTPHLVCNVENPLKDLPWLKAQVDEITLLSQQGNPLRIAIYECMYDNKKTGFLIDEGNIKPFYNCSGDILCVMGGWAGETCSELNIVKQELIWEINN